MTTTAQELTGAPPVGWRASAWGGFGGLVALGAAAALGRQAAAWWPATDGSGAGTAVLAAMLVLAAVLLGWVATVLLVAGWQVRPAGRPAGPRGSSSTAVRVATSLLVCLASGAGTAGAAPAVVTTAVDDGGPGSCPTAAGRAPDEVSAPAPVDVPLPGWTPAAADPPSRPQGEIDLVGGRDDARWELPTHVVVRRGDTLWDLAARHLGPGATSADVAQEWPRWYTANLGVIGPDPDLILPGQQLRVPGTEGSQG